MAVDLPRFPSSSTQPPTLAGPRKETAGSLSRGFVACTLPREATGAPRTPVKVKPPVMKKPVRSAEMIRRLSEYQQQQQQLTD